MCVLLVRHLAVHYHQIIISAFRLSIAAGASSHKVTIPYQCVGRFPDPEMT